MAITTCSIFTRLEFSAIDRATSLEGTISELSWRVDLEGPVFASMMEQQYRFDTSGHNWIRTPLDGAIISTLPEINSTNFPTPAPSTKTSGGQASMHPMSTCIAITVLVLSLL
jgi:hypothetical protein